MTSILPATNAQDNHAGMAPHLALTGDTAAGSRHHHLYLLGSCPEALSLSTLPFHISTIEPGPLDTCIQSLTEAVRKLKAAHQTQPYSITVIINAAGSEALGSLVPATRQACGPDAFLVHWHPRATEDPAMRVLAFKHGSNMVTFDAAHLAEALGRVASQCGTGSVSCDLCSMSHLSAAGYWAHLPLYHIYAPNFAAQCQVCGEHAPNLQVHVHEAHCPSGPYEEVRLGIGSAVIVHRPEDDRYLMVQEFAAQGFWLPGGGLDHGETLRQCAVRECLEEAGVEVELKGVLEVQHQDRGTYMWRLVTFYAHLRQAPEPAAQPGALEAHAPSPKTLPDFESAGACWVSHEDLDAIPLRDDNLPRRWFKRLAGGGAQRMTLNMELPVDVEHMFSDVQF